MGPLHFKVTQIKVVHMGSCNFINETQCHRMAILQCGYDTSLRNEEDSWDVTQCHTFLNLKPPLLNMYLSLKSELCMPPSQ